MAIRTLSFLFTYCTRGQAVSALEWFRERGVEGQLDTEHCKDPVRCAVRFMNVGMDGYRAAVEYSEYRIRQVEYVASEFAVEQDSHDACTRTIAQWRQMAINFRSILKDLTLAE
jgi:hypothetical protein